MSVFKKPRKNIRRRIGIDEEDEGSENENKGDVEEDENVTHIQATINKVKEKKKDRRKGVLSFEEELNEADDGEVFQVKKSSQSKKIMKLLDKERKKKKEMKKDEEKVENCETIDKPKEDPSELVIVLKNTEMPVIMNGREAEVADVEGVSSDEDEKYPKFSQPDHVKLLLESGRIPDAAMIHAARKRRQMAREMGGDYVPIEIKKTETAKSRLVREDDNDASDDERITMEVNTAARDKERRREAFMAAQDQVIGEESDKGEDEEWESQQIRKGVTGAQLAAVQQESIYQQYGVIVPPMALSPALMIPPEMPQVVSNGTGNAATLMQQGPESASNVSIFPTMKTEITSPQAITNRLRDRLTSLKEVHHRHTRDRDQVADDLVSLHNDRERLEAEGPVLAQRFRFYQELRGYVTDLVECLDEKVGSYKIWGVVVSCTWDWTRDS